MYEGQLFRASLYRHAVPIAWVLHRISPDFFREDMGFIRDLGGVVSGSEVLMELNRFYGRNVRDRNWLRKLLRLRISGKRVQRLARIVFRAR